MFKLGQKNGFTLAEMIVTVSIIMILSVVVTASVNRYKFRGRDAKRQADLQQISLAVQQYRLAQNDGSYPRCYQGVTVKTVCSSTGYEGSLSTLQISPAFMNAIPVDPKNVATQYGYYYARGYRKTGSNVYIYTGLATDYILATRLEDVSGNVFAGWDNTQLNYLIGN